jgi:dUTP pyrophosphatase
MFKSGKFVSEYVTQEDGSNVSEKQVQPHGVELTVGKIFKCRNYTVLGDDEYAKARREEAHITGPGTYMDRSSGANHRRESITEVTDKDAITDGPLDLSDEVIEIDEPHYVLLEGPYVVRYNEVIEIPDGHLGFVWPRSRLIRSGNYLSSAVWDSGYTGRGEGGLHINCMTFLQQNMRIGQIAMCEADTTQQYSGSHQNENMGYE